AGCASRGEAQSPRRYQQSCGEKGAPYKPRVEAICARLRQEGGSSGQPARLARILRVTVEGVWLDMMTMAEPYSTAEALATARTCAARLFPRHFEEPE